MIQSIIIIVQHLKKNENICIFKCNCLFQFTFSLKYGICEFLKIFFYWPTCEHVFLKIFTRIHWIEYKMICWLVFLSVSCTSVALGRFVKFGWTTTKIQFRMCQKIEIYGAFLKIALVWAFLCYRLAATSVEAYILSVLHREFRSHSMQESKEKTSL